MRTKLGGPSTPDRAVKKTGQASKAAVRPDTPSVLRAAMMKVRVFISYATINNLPSVGVREGWVDRLEMELRNRLAEEVGRLDRFELWRDQAFLNNFEEIGGQIAEALRTADIFLMVVSRAYLASRWCNEVELPAFVSSHFGQRIFCVKMRPVNPEDLPEPLREVLGFDFWEEEPGGTARWAIRWRMRIWT